jgi:hypothetical protein
MDLIKGLFGGNDTKIQAAARDTDMCQHLLR